MTPALSERRLKPRVALKIPLRYTVRGTGRFWDVVSEDLGAGGVCFTNQGFLPVKTPLMMEMNLLSRALNPIGRVAWINSLAHSDSYRVGVEFIELDSVNKEYLNDFVDMKMSVAE